LEIVDGNTFKGDDMEGAGSYLGYEDESILKKDTED
jgi:hypothetical protein